MDRQHLGHMLSESAGKFPSHIAMKEWINDRWAEWTYDEFLDQAHAVARSLIHCNLQPNDRVGIFSRNLPAWSMVETS